MRCFEGESSSLFTPIASVTLCVSFYLFSFRRLRGGRSESDLSVVE